MAQDREVLLKKLTGLLRRITDAEDDYTVTADQRAALMELESLTWNYPTPQQGRGRGSNIPATSFPSDDQTDTDDDDDDDSYYVDMVPYDMTERLKEVNRAFIDDPTPAECNRAITVRFREVIADFQSPREYYPSDSDDGYGDSSDLIYDAEDDENGLTSLTNEVRDILADNVKVIDFMTPTMQHNGLGDFSNISSTLNGFSEDAFIKDYNSIGTESSRVSTGNNKSLPEEKKADVPKLHLSGSNHEESQLKPNVDNFLTPPHNKLPGSQVPSEISMLKVDDSGLADLESFVKDNDGEDIEEDLPRDPTLSAEGEILPVGSVSLIEASDQMYVDKGFSSLDNLASGDLRVKGTSNESDSVPDVFFQKKEPREPSGSPHQQLPAKSESDFATFDYADDFEDFQEDFEDVKPVIKVSEKQPPKAASPPMVPPVQLKEEPEKTAEHTCHQNRTESHATEKAERKSKQVSVKDSPQKHGHKSRREQSSRKSPSSSAERTKKRTESRSPAEITETSSVRSKPKKVASGPPTIKPALLSSDKISHMKTSDTSRYKSRNPSSSRTVNGSITPSSSPSLSASSSSSSSSSPSSYSTPGGLRGRSRKPINGPVRPTQHKSPVGGRASSRGISNSPVRSPTTPPHPGLALSPVGQPASPNPSGRPSPPYRVRKAASASDLHSSSRVSEDSEDRQSQSDAVFRAWLQQKNKQAALAKKQQRKTSGGRSNSEVAERRARAEEAFQAWLARKRDQLRLEKKLRGERRRLEDQSRYARTKAECEVAYKEWCRRKRDEVRTVRPNGVVPRSQSLERPWVQEKTRKLYSAYLNGH